MGEQKDAKTVADLKAQYSYKANSNLVLPQEGRRRGRQSDTGEVRPLRASQLDGRMGDKAGPREGEEKDPELKRRLEKMRQKAREPAQLAPRSLADVVETADHLQLSAGGVGYIPSNPVSQRAYEALLAFVVAKLGDQPYEYLRDAAEELLTLFKAEDTPNKRAAAAELLDAEIADDELAKLTQFANGVDDFGAEAAAQPPVGDELTRIDGGADDDAGVAVIIGDEDEDSESAPDEVRDLVDADGNPIDDATPVLRGAGGDDDDSDDDEGATEQQVVVGGDDDASGLLTFDPRNIDGFWIQRQLEQHYSDAHECQQVAEKVLDILCEPTHNASCENKLMDLFFYEHVQFVKYVVRHRTAVSFCTRLARAQGEGERATIERELRETEEGKELLDALSEKPLTSDEPTNARKRRKKADPPTNPTTTTTTTPSETNANGQKTKRKKRKIRKLDLDDLVFHQGNHLMSAKKFSINAEHLQYKDYEEWHIAAPDDGLRIGDRPPFPVTSLPAWAQQAFAKVTHLNRLQTAVQPVAFETDENLLICAPTGAGKTNVALLTVLRALYNAGSTAAAGASMLDFKSSDADLSAFKVVYVAPMKALVAEVVSKFQTALKAFGIVVRELTGDVNLTRRQIEETQIIVTTPEKWDVITRKSGERTFTSLVRLLIIDEIHLLHDDRGPVLEAIIARTMRNVESATLLTRVVGLSATLPNYKDVAALLHVDAEKGMFHFDSSYRPSPLQQCYVGITARKATRRFRIMNDIMYDKVQKQVAANNPVIVFVHSRKETFASAKLIVDRAIEDESIGYFMQHDSPSYNTIQAELDDVDNPQLKALLIRGIGTHNAGMSRKDRMLVEGLFEARHIKVLVSTATLAWGVNLPAHAVIIKGTQIYSPEKGRWIELSPLDVMQMMGRAGRPQFDKFGEGFIITSSSEVQFYLSLLNQQLPIESHFVSRLVDMLNAEIATGCVSNIDQGAKWLTYTYLFIRMVRNPALYHVPADERAADATLHKRRMELIHSAALVLHKAKLIKYNRKTGELATTDVGKIASDFYVGYRTMAVYAEHMHPHMGDLDLFRLFSLSSEFNHMRVREEEKVEVEKLSEIVPIPIKDPANAPAAKVNLLLQAYIAALRLDGLVLKADMVYITQNAARLTRALLQIFIQKRWAAATEACLELCKMVENRQWAVQSPLRQFRALLGSDTLRKIERKFVDFERLLQMSSAELGELFRDLKTGKAIHKLVHSLPLIELEVKVRPLTRSSLRFEVVLKPDFMFREILHGAGEAFWVFVQDADAHTLLHAESFFLRRSVARENHTLVFNVPVTTPRPPHYFVKCFSDRWIVPPAVAPVPFHKLILPEKFAPHTQYLALRPLPVEASLVLDAALAVDEDACNETLSALRSYFTSVLGENLTPLLNQMVPAIFKNGENAVIATLPGRDRDLATCLAIGRLFALQPTSTVVWIVGGDDDDVGQIVTFLKEGVAKVLKLDVNVLKGQHSVDVATLGKGASIVVSIPQHFDAFSRKWQGKKEGAALAGIGLVFLDGIHMMCEDVDAGIIMEVVGSRMRYVAQQLLSDKESTYRIVAISDPIANAKDAAEWLGVRKESILSFLPSSLPSCPSVEVWPCVSRFGGGTLSSPAALSRRILDAMKRFAAKGTESVVIFVPSRKVARAMALEMVAVAANQESENGYLRVSSETIEPYLNKIRLSSLRECVKYGVVYLHEELPANEREIGEIVFRKGAARILVTTPKFSRKSEDVKGRLVVIAGTAMEEAGGYSMERAEYPRSEMTRMISCATPSNHGITGNCVVLTERPLKEYYEQSCLKPVSLESQLTEVLADQINAEVASGVIEDKESVLHYLTWTFYFRRLPKNPNYYNLGGTSHMEKSSHLSSIVDQALSDLKESKCVASEENDDSSLIALNLGNIAAYYYIQHATVEIFAASVTPTMKMRAILDILSCAAEFDDIPMRFGEEKVLERLSGNVPVKLSKMNDEDFSFSSLNVKVHLLIQAHLSRLSLAGDVSADVRIVVGRSVQLIRALVDIVSSAGWLAPTLFCMELSQMIVQALWSADKPLMQLPHFDEQVADEFAKHEVTGIPDVFDMEPALRKKLLSHLSREQVSDVAKAIPKFPEVSWTVDEPVFLGDEERTVLIVARLERVTDEDDDDEPVTVVPTVYAPHFPRARSEGWWIVVGDNSSKSLLTVRHVTLKQHRAVKLRFTAPLKAGRHELTVSLVSDSYVDMDLEENITLEVPSAGGESAGMDVQ